tara:strand:+ start:154 stop:414 length:261 start_codon:yes stop_codon:yes gene_type:complete
MEAAWPYIVDIVMTVVPAALFTMIGFVWKISHKVSNLEKSLQAFKGLHDRDISEVKKDVDVIYNNVDKNREWTTNRMMSIAKEMGS